ncbi:MAG: ribulose bisphosphate carboxylase small subunit [Rivularia sp. (in: cyanobacteria)]
MGTIIQNPEEKNSGSNFRYPPTPTYPNKQLQGDSTFRYPETSNKDYSEQSRDSTFVYPPTSSVNHTEQLGGSTFLYPPTTTVTPFPAPHTSADSYTATSRVSESRDYHPNPHNAQMAKAHVELEILEQMREILASGNHIGIEYVDERRFRIGSWNTYAGHQIQDMADAIAALEACLVEHNNDYVRVFGIEPKANRRLSEIMVQRPSAKLVRR